MKLLWIGLIVATLSLAATPIGTVSSPQPILLDGHALAAAGVTSWPVVLGDEITTSTAPATVLFKDGSDIKLAQHSKAKITGTEARPKVVLMAGNIDYKLAADSNLSLAAAGSQNAPAQNGNGQTPAANSQSPGGQAPTDTSSEDSASRSISTGASIGGSHHVLLGVLTAGTLAGIGLGTAALLTQPTVSNH